MSRMRIVRTSAAFIATAAALSSSAIAACIPNNFSDDGLLLQEAAGGRTIREHVGKSDRDQEARLAQQTTTAGLATNAAVTNALAQKGKDPPKAFDYVDPNGNTVGRVASRNAMPPPITHVTASCAYRAVIRLKGPGKCYLLTSYPILPRPGDNCRS